MLTRSGFTLTPAPLLGQPDSYGLDFQSTASCRDITRTHFLPRSTKSISSFTFINAFDIINTVETQSNNLICQAIAIIVSTLSGCLAPRENK